MSVNINISTENLNYIFKNVIDIKIESGWDITTDTADFSVPNKLSLNNKKIVVGDGTFKRGDNVNIILSYQGFNDYDNEFNGYITDIIPGDVIRFKCQDSYYLLKKTTIKDYSAKTVTLKGLLTDILPTDMKFNCVDSELGQFRIKNGTVANVLEELKNTYGLLAWFRKGILNVGRAYYPGEARERLFSMQKNIINNSLEWRTSDTAGVFLKGVSILENNKKIDLYAYYENGKIKISKTQPDGGQRVFNYYNINEATLKENITRDLPLLAYEGYYGSFETFGYPPVRHGDYVTIDDLKIPERKGKYVVKKVNKTFGSGGFRQNIELFSKV